MRFRSIRSGVAIAALATTSIAFGGSAAVSASDATPGAGTPADTPAPSDAALVDDAIVAHDAARASLDGSSYGRAERASASPRLRTEAVQTLTDPVGDSFWLRGDLDIAGVDAASDGFTSVAAGVAMYTSPFGVDWQYGVTGPVWFIDVNADGNPDSSVVMLNSDGFLVAGVLDAGGDVVCDAYPEYDAPLRMYFATFPTACIGDPATFTWISTMLYEDVGVGGESFDRAPNAGWAGPAVNDGRTPPTVPTVPTDPTTTPPTTPTPLPGGEGFVSLVPARLLDTRPAMSTVDGRFNGTGTVVAGTTTQLEVAGRGGVPANASAAVLNVTAVDPRSAGYLTIFPCGAARPNASSVNFDAGSTVPNAVMTRLGADGTVCVYAQATVDLLVDVNGYFSGEQAFSSLNPARVLETRPGLSTVDGQFDGIGAQAAGTTLELIVAGRGGVPLDASSVALNVTAVDARSAGFLTVYPCGGPRPNASSVNFAAGRTVANAVVSKVGANGRVCIFTQATTDLIVDVNGWFGSSSPFGSVVPARLYESRRGLATVDGVHNGTGPTTAGSVVQVAVIGRGGVPANATAVVLNVTVTGPSSAGFVTVFPCGSSLPNASNLNFTTGQTVPNAVVSKIGTGGRVCVYAQAATDLIVDVNGYFV